MYWFIYWLFLDFHRSLIALLPCGVLYLTAFHIGNAEHARLLECSEILRGEAFAVLSRLAQTDRRFGLIFCDPPYHSGLCGKVLQKLDDSEILASGGLLVLEHGGDEVLPDGELCTLECIREVCYGHTSAIHIFRRKENAS